MTLWSKFQTTVRYVYQATQAAIAIIEVGQPLNVQKLLDEQTIATAAPTLPTDGLSIGGIRWIDICYKYSEVAAAGSAEGILWVYNGILWVNYETLSFGKVAGALNAFDSGSYSRMAIELSTAPSSGNIDVYANNTNTES